MSDSVPPEVSVIVATYGRPDMIGDALASLAQQTLEHDRFEVVVVINGPSEGTAEAVEAVATEHPDLRVVV
ncbi:glycosyltransferase, partial [Nocardioides sp.]|uniref:glycosyltransferase n=1 Tax=Nocardioides sp. TaxID=35761 RepID=UPI0025E937EE